MDIQTQTLFAPYYTKFCTNDHKVSDIGLLLDTIRYSKFKISDDAIRLLLQIPYCVLKSQVDLKTDSTVWAKENGQYFSGNCQNTEYAEIFASYDFNLDTMVAFFDFILSDITRIRNDFYLRNPEVTLRDDVVIKSCANFQESGRIYALTMEKAFMI